jgi:hypothetical protein
MAMSARSDRLDQFEEGNAAGGYPGELEAILYPAVSPSMTPRRFPTPWHADKLLGGYVIRDANGPALAYVYTRDNEAEPRQARSRPTPRQSLLANHSSFLRVKWESTQINRRNSAEWGAPSGTRDMNRLSIALLKSCWPMAPALH